MGTLDHSWRLLLSAGNEAALCELVYQQITAIVIFSTKKNLIDESEYLIHLADCRNDLTKFARALNEMSRPYFLSGKGYDQNKLTFRDLTFLIQREAIGATKSSKPVIQSLAALGFEIPPLVNTLKQHRNRQSHNNSQMEEPEYALQLAAAVLRLINIRLAISEDLRPGIDELKGRAMKIVNYCSSYYTIDPESDSGGQQSKSDTPPPKAIEERSKQNSPETSSDKTNAYNTRAIEDLSSLIQSFQTSTEKSISAIEMKVSDLVDRIGSSSYESTAISSATSTTTDQDNNQKHFLSENDDNEEWQFRHEQALNEEAVRDQLLKMRIDIKNHYSTRGIKIANWINILQRPIVEELIEKKVTTEEKWRELSTFQEKWKVNFSDRGLMDKQLEYWAHQALNLLHRMVTNESFEKITKEIDA